MGAQLGYGRTFFFHCYKLITAFSASHRIWCICIFAYVEISLDFPFGFFFDELVVQEYIVSFPLFLLESSLVIDFCFIAL